MLVYKESALTNLEKSEIPNAEEWMNEWTNEYEWVDEQMNKPCIDGDYYWVEY